MASRPNLPGFVHNGVDRDRHNKAHIFSVVDGIPTVGDAKGKGNHMPSSTQTIPLQHNKFLFDRTDLHNPIQSKSVIPDIKNKPKWIEYDRKVLRFWAYTKESVLFSNEEKQRIRRFTICYYLADDTVHVNEKVDENSGMPQGLFLKREKLPVDGDRFAHWTDFRVGQIFKIFGREFHIIGCDKQSREFYEQNGENQMANVDFPDDEHTESRKKFAQGVNKRDTGISSYLEAKCGKLQSFQLQRERQYLAHDGKVLRFWCYWNDVQVYGRVHHYQLHYFLADDTIAIHEDYPTNAGTQHFPVFLHRSKLPKKLPCHGVALIGVDHTDDIPYVTHADLRIGGYVTVYGRHMLLTRCDEYTKLFYRDVHGLDESEFDPIEEMPNYYEVPKVKPAPHNGFGIEEDSIGSVCHLVPSDLQPLNSRFLEKQFIWPTLKKTEKKNFNQLMKYDTKVLRFKAVFAKPCKEDELRKFVIEYYRSDNTIKIFEVKQPNSGFDGGKFLQRCRLKNPATGTYYEPQEFYVGCVIIINKFAFKITEAGDFTMKHMEGEPSTFPFANKDLILQKLADKLWDRSNRKSDTFRLFDKNHDAQISRSEFEDMMKTYGWELSEHELLTLWRAYDVNGDGSITFTEFFNAIENHKHSRKSSVNKGATALLPVADEN